MPHGGAPVLPHVVQCTLVAGYTGLPHSVQIYGETPDCAGVDATFATYRLPTFQELRAVEAVLPGATRPGCAPATPVAGRSGLTPLQSRTCPGAEGTAVTWSRWAGPDCDTVERSVAALGPPPAGTLPD